VVRFLLGLRDPHIAGVLLQLFATASVLRRTPKM
jgi:hypothetical protein